ncbi:hypothetical protein MPH_04218 [Macrophomina phaseolina MS6]|uniref:Uncharacterized protein n=1 Tax=Macrophomina phaseolina (strain MS6) TaxID=1126212 RepID=K2R7Q7_MACPH|nr:hypothetical protein MPH_04218 [Macrophomina phaseolina MS6]
MDLYHHLKTCNDVKSLALSIQEGGCVIDADAPFSFDFSCHDSFPSSIENLTVSNYDWDASSGGINHAQLWSKTMDWTSLKRLDIDRPPQSFVDAFTGRLPSLQSLTIRPKWSSWGTERAFCSFDDSSTSMRQNYTSFITSMPPLEELHISGMGEHLDLAAILATHGHTLRNLTIHELEGDCACATGNTTWTRPFMNADQLRTVKEMAPNLRGLAIDLDRNATHLAVEELAALSTFPNLRELTLHFDLEDTHRTYISRTCTVSNEWAREQYCKKFQLLEPLLGTEEAGAMLKAVGGPARPARTLDKLNVIVGNFNRKVGQVGLPVDFYHDPNEPYVVNCQFQDMRCSKTVWDDWEWQYERVEDNSHDSEDWPMYALVEYWPVREEI